MARGIGSSIGGSLKYLTGQKKTTAGRGIGSNLRSTLPVLTGQGQERTATGGVFGGLRGVLRQSQGAITQPAPTPPAEPAEQRRKRPLAETDIGALVTGITSQDSPMMESARLKGLQQAQARGLLSSSMAVQSAEQAAYDAALPLAQTQAQINASQNESRFQRQFEAAQNKRDRRFESGQNALDRQAQFDLKDMDLDAVDRAKVADMVSTAKSNMESAIDAVMRNENLSAEQREQQIAKIRTRNRAWIAGIQDLYNVDISFGQQQGQRSNQRGNDRREPDQGEPAPSPQTEGGTGFAGSRPQNPKQGDVWTAPNGQRFVWSGSRWAETV